MKRAAAAGAASRDGFVVGGAANAAFSSTPVTTTTTTTSNRSPKFGGGGGGGGGAGSGFVASSSSSTAAGYGGSAIIGAGGGGSGGSGGSSYCFTWRWVRVNTRRPLLFVLGFWAMMIFLTSTQTEDDTAFAAAVQVSLASIPTHPLGCLLPPPVNSPHGFKPLANNVSEPCGAHHARMHTSVGRHALFTFHFSLSRE